MVYHVLHAVGDVEGDVGGGSAGAPGDVAEGGVVGHHPIHPLEQVLNALLRLGREELEGEHRPPTPIHRFLDLLDNLHLSLCLSPFDGFLRKERVLVLRRWPRLR